MPSAARRDATARCWSTGTSRIRCERTFDEHTDWVNDLVLLGDESRLVTARSALCIAFCCPCAMIGVLPQPPLLCRASDTTLKIWNTANQRVIHTLDEHQDYVKALAYARHTGQLASAGLDRDVLLWDLETGQKTVSGSLWHPTEHESGSEQQFVGLCGDGERGTGPGGQRVPVQSQINMTPCSGHRDSVYCLATNPAGTLLVSGSTER
eukprot:1815825-Rhodomonas_salina.5